MRRQRVMRVARAVALAWAMAWGPEVASAAPVVYTETFVFPDVPGFPTGVPAGQNYYIGTDPSFCDTSVFPFACQRAYAEILFDISELIGTNPANQATYFGEIALAGPGSITTGAPLGVFDTETPSADASGYVAGGGLASAVLMLSFRGVDLENDSVLVQAFGADGGTVIFQATLTGSVPSTSFPFVLDATTLSALAVDGRLGIRISSFGNDIFTHDFNLESATLQATTVDAAVPEPATLVLVGAGLAVAMRRRRRA